MKMIVVFLASKGADQTYVGYCEYFFFFECADIVCNATKFTYSFVY